MRELAWARDRQASAFTERTSCYGIRGVICLSAKWTIMKGESGMAKSAVQHSKVVSQAKWLEARKELLKKEKEFSRLRDELSRRRREMPWEKVEKAYAFDGPGGKETLADLFGGRSQLIVYHFMLGPGWKEGCPSCSFISDHIDGSVVHLAARDVRLVVVSRAPLEKSKRSRSGWPGDSIGCRRMRPTSITTTRYQ